MEAPTPNLSLPAISQLSSPTFFFDSFTEPPSQSPFMATTLQDEDHLSQNYDRDNISFLPPPSQAPVEPRQPPAQPETVSPTNEAPAGPPSTDAARPADVDNGSGSDHNDSDGDDEQDDPNNQWQAIDEDKSAPCEDELAYIASREAHSAIDYEYWQKTAFFDLDDPAFASIESGRIDFLVEHFNGTKEAPNRELVMRSEVVRIGGYDWRIKFYPKGNNADALSAYIECVTMQAADFEEAEDFQDPPLPFLAGQERQKKRRIAAAQLLLIMYNPAEPRTHLHHMDAHQFHKGSTDYGWSRFTRYSRRDFHFRGHGQHQAILRDDKLAFSAFIRVVDDPTNCLWAHHANRFEDSKALTGLRPFSTLTPYYSAQVPLLHFAPFRDFIYRCNDTRIVSWFQNLLWKMLSRTSSAYYGTPRSCVPSDAIAWLRYSIKHLKSEIDTNIVTDLVGTFEPDQGAAICGNRLKTKDHGSIQAAVDAHPSPLATPALLTLELERHEYDPKARKWNKLTNKVEMQDKILVGGISYTLFAFSTHCGDLNSNNFNVYVRPSSSGGLWYAYTDGNVECLTHKQAIDKRCGTDQTAETFKHKRHAISRHDYSLRHLLQTDNRNEVAHVVMYVRHDCSNIAASSPIEEAWEVPERVRLGLPPADQKDLTEPPQTAVGIDALGSEMQRQLEEQIERTKKSSIDGRDAGNATPYGLLMDGEDVVMSDVDDESVCADGDASGSAQNSLDEILNTITIDHLGREYYHGQVFGPYYHGEGHLIAMNGDEYTGSFSKHAKSGYGKMVYASTGNIYEGYWLEDQHHGEGKLTEASTGNVFEGGWKHGKKHGKFVLTGTVTEEDKGCCSICYDQEINTAFYDCGHVLACRECANKVDQCPVCRKRVTHRLELFGVKMTFE